MLASVHCHPESFLTASTLANLIAKSKALGRQYFTYTDQGHLSSALKAYSLAKKEKLKPILGLEAFFYDPTCDILGGTPAARCQYFQFSVFAKDQEAYQAIVKLVSKTDFATISVYDEEKQLFTWADLKTLSQYNVEMVIGGSVHDIVGKVYLASDAQLACRVFLKLKELFGDKLSVALLCEKWDKKFSQVVEIIYKDGTKDSILASDSVSTDRARNIKAIDLVTKSHHSHIKSKKVGSTFYSVDKELSSVKLHRGYLPLPVDASLKINKLLYALAKNFGANVLVTDYAFYCDREDKIVQELVLEGKTRLYPTLNMKSDQEFLDYLINVMGLSKEESESILANNDKWAHKFDNFELKYETRLAECEGTGIKQVMEIIKKNGRMKWDDPIWLARLKEELAVIEQNNIFSMTPYFLPIHDVLSYYKENQRLTGPGRGSAAGSLVAFLLGITQVNPFKFDLSFNRFYSMDRIRDKKLADIDSDLEDRDLLVGIDKKSGYLYNRWGNKAAQISTRTMLRLKSAIKDTNRYINGRVESSIEVFTKSLPAPPQGVTDQEYIFGFEDQEGEHTDGLIETSESLQKYTEERPKEWEIVQKMLGITRAQSLHACLSGEALVDNNGIVEKLKNSTFSENKPIHVWSNGIKDTVFVSLNNGVTIQCTPDHKFITLDGEIEAQNLHHKEVIYKKFNNVSGRKTLDKEFLFALGWGLNDGTFVKERTNQCFYFTPGKDDNCKTKVISYLESVGVTWWTVKNREDSVYCGSINLPEEFFESNKNAMQRLPHYFWNLDYISQCHFMNGFMSANGYILNTTKRVGFKISSRLLASDICSWMIANDILTGALYIPPKTFNIRGKECKNNGSVEVSIVSFESRVKFRQDIGFLQKYKSDRLLEITKEKPQNYGFHGRKRITRCLSIANAGKIEVFDFNEPLENVGYINGILVHNCAFVIADKPINEVVPVKDGHVTQYTAAEVEAAGLVKYDFLVISQLKDIRVCLNYVNKHDNSGVPFDHLMHDGKSTYIWDLPEEAEVFKSVWSGDTESIFQIATRSMIPFVMSIKPQSIEDLAIILALVRPGPLDYIDPNTGRSMAEEYVHRRQGGEFDDIKILKELIPETYGVLCYQEQVTKIAKEVAGFNGSEAEKLRENIGKKKLTALLATKPKFVSGCVATDKVTQKEAEELWERIATFGRYAFNKSHAISYAYITYACMFLRRRHALEWWSAVATNAKESEITGKFWPYLKPYFAAPDINISTDEMVIDYPNNKLRAKFGVIRGLGDKTAEPIIQGRPYKDIDDFVKKDVATTSMTRKLIHVGVLDSLFPAKLSFLEKLKMFEDCLEKHKFLSKKEKADKEGKTIRQTEPKEGELPEEYLNLHPLEDARMKKATLPSLVVGLHDLGARYSKVLNERSSMLSVKNSKGYATPLVNGETLLRIAESDGMGLEKDLYIAAVGYINEISEFPYSNNTKKALKLNLDFDGISLGELVQWPDFNSGDLVYDQNTKKGSIITVFFRKKVGKKEMSIQEFVLESFPKTKKALTKEKEQSKV